MFILISLELELQWLLYLLAFYMMTAIALLPGTFWWNEKSYTDTPWRLQLQFIPHSRRWVVIESRWNIAMDLTSLWGYNNISDVLVLTLHWIVNALGLHSCCICAFFKVTADWKHFAIFFGNRHMAWANYVNNVQHKQDLCKTVCA